MQVYLAIANSLYRAYTDETVQPRERAKLAWTVVIFLQLWKQWLNVEGHNNSKHFITDQTFTDTILARHSVVLSMMVFWKYPTVLGFLVVIFVKSYSLTYDVFAVEKIISVFLTC